MIRAFKRNQLRKQVGNRNLREAWETFQNNKYGKNYKRICSRKRGK